MSVTAGLAGLEAAFQWCCRRRRRSPPDADIWHLWFHWSAIREDLSQKLTCNTYRLSALQVVGRGRDAKAVWSAQDAVVLKWVAMQLQAILPVHPLCEHHKGHGGGKRSVQRMHGSLQREGWQYVCRTDIQGFYAHIRRGPLMRQLKRHVQDPVLLDLVRQYLHYSVERGGEFHTPAKGICRGCALSPLLAGFCLWAMDTYFEAQPHVRYVRFMDDMVIFTRTRWHLRQAVRALNVFFASGGYRQHPDKTFIGRTERGFDWMGIQFNGSGIEGVAPRALANHRERCRRLYEQVWRYGKKKTMARVSAYVKRWTIWRNSMTDSVHLRTRARRLISAGWLAATLAVAGLAVPTAALALDGCDTVLYKSASNSGGMPIGITASAAVVNYGTPNLYPPYGFIGSALAKSGKSARCLLGANKSISIVLGSYVRKNSEWTSVDGVWHWTRIRDDQPGFWGADGDEAYCYPSSVSVGGSSICYRARLRVNGPLACTGADGTHAASPSNGNLSPYGGQTATVPCSDRPDGTGVDITVPSVTYDVYTNSAAGYATSGSMTQYNGSTAQLESTTLLLGASPTSPAPRQCNSTPNTPDHNCYVNAVNTGKLEIHLTSVSPGTCTAILDQTTLDFSTISADASGIIGQPLPAITPRRSDIRVSCTGTNAVQPNKIILIARGELSGYSGVFASTNDSVGYQVKAGGKGVPLVNGIQTVLTNTDGITIAPGAGASTDLTSYIDAAPVALANPLIPGRATANITLDIYAAAD